MERAWPKGISVEEYPKLMKWIRQENGKWVNNSGVVDVRSHDHKAQEIFATGQAPFVRGDLPIEVQAQLKQITDQDVVSYSQMDDMGLTFDTQTTSAPASKPSVKEQVMEDMKRVRIPRDLAGRLGEGFEVVENTDGSIDLVPSDKVEKELVSDDFEEDTVYDDPKVTMLDLQQRAISQAQKNWKARRA